VANRVTIKRPKRSSSGTQAVFGRAIRAMGLGALAMDVTAIDAEGLTREGNSYVNDAYGNSDVILEVDVEGGVGEINLEVV
jgi:hypothetical protein